MKRSKRRQGPLSRAERRILQETGLRILKGHPTRLQRDDMWVLARRTLVKVDGTLTARGRRSAVARAAQHAAKLEWGVAQDARYDALQEALEAASGTWDENETPEWMWDDMTDEALLVKVKALREARAAYDNYVAAPAPKLTQREAEVWLMQRKLEGKLDEILEYV